MGMLRLPKMKLIKTYATIGKFGKTSLPSWESLELRFLPLLFLEVSTWSETPPVLDPGDCSRRQRGSAVVAPKSSVRLRPTVRFPDWWSTIVNYINETAKKYLNHLSRGWLHYNVSEIIVWFASVQIFVQNSYLVHVVPSRRSTQELIQKRSNKIENNSLNKNQKKFDLETHSHKHGVLLYHQSRCAEGKPVNTMR